MKAGAVATPPWVRAVMPHASVLGVLGTRDGVPHVLRVADGPGHYVAKHYDDGRGQHAVRAMRAVALALASQPTPFLALPAIASWSPRHRVLVQSVAPGQPLLACLAGRQRRQALTAAARALATLHSSGAAVGATTTMRDHVEALIRPHPRVVADAVPGLATRLRALTSALVRWAPPRPVRAVAIHRDAHARQMLADRHQVWLLDWDLSARGDAALDVANFAVYLATHLEAGQAAATRFLDAYAVHGDDLSSRLPEYTALTYLRLVCKTWRLGRPGRLARMRRLLDLAERAL